jgi:amidohydrolase
MTLDENLLAWVVEQRRWFHQHPEPGFREFETQKHIITLLDELGIENRAAASTGVIATVYGTKPGPCIALRADMDGLRIAEPETAHNRDYRSQNPEYMHACGHDGHMAIVLGAARLLQQHRAELTGNVRVIFQPSEETLPGGAIRIIAEGGLDDVDGIVGLHLLGQAPLGEFRFRPGPFLAHTCDFSLTITGKGGHHMCPQKNIDPIALAARFVSTIQADLKARIAPDKPWVLGFGTLHGGTQFNQTPEQVTSTGSFRAFETKVTETIEATMRSSLDGLLREFRSEQAGVEPRYELTVKHGYPVLRNHPAFTRRAGELLKSEFASVVDNWDLNLGAEDFAYYLEEVPGMFSFLGASSPALGINEINHSSRFDIDEKALGIGVRACMALTLDFLAHPSSYTEKLKGQKK